jgi:predicted Zn-dependent protease
MNVILALVIVLTVSVGARASDVELSGAEGHPRARFPLAVHLAAAGDAALDAAGRRAVADWNAVAEPGIATRVFREVAVEGEAQVRVALHAAESARMMGATRLATDARGVIELPVQITVFPAAARGQTPREVLHYQIVAHELGHALGLPHTRDPRSLMCCVHASLDFNDPAVRETYIAARRQPDVRSSAAELSEHYTKFWRRTP